MSDIAILKEMIQDDVTVPLEESEDNKKKVTLSESDSDYDVTIVGMPNDVIVIKADAFKSSDGVFVGSKGERKRADFVIIANNGSKKVVVCIEMKRKSKTSPLSEVVQQLKGAQGFVAYCQAIGKLFWEQQNFLDGYIYRFVSIRNIGIAKKMTREYHETGLHDRLLKIGFPDYLEFNHLVGKGK